MYWRFYFSGHLDWQYIQKLSDNFHDDFAKSDLAYLADRDPIFSISVVDNIGD